MARHYKTFQLKCGHLRTLLTSLSYRQYHCYICKQDEYVLKV